MRNDYAIIDAEANHLSELRPADAKSGIRAIVWLPAIVGAIAYPLLVRLLFSVAQSTTNVDGTTSIAYSICAAVIACMALAAPALALKGLFEISHSKSGRAPYVRRLLHAAFATPPLYLLAYLPATVIGHSFDVPLYININDSLWWSMWLIVTAFTCMTSISGATAPEPKRGIPTLSSSTSKLRSAHRYAAASLLLLFLLFHLGNHLVALWSTDSHRVVMDILRRGYRSAWMEPIILGLCALASIAGMALVGRHTRFRSDKFRVLQTASGTYLALFIANHVLAVFTTRAAGRDTDWAFATGGAAGMLGSYAYTAVFLYYTLAVFLAGVHGALGARMMLLARGRDKTHANQVAYGTIGFSTIITVLIVAALLGARVGY